MALSSGPGSDTFDAPAADPSALGTRLDDLLAQDLRPEILEVFVLEIPKDGEIVFSSEQSAALIGKSKILLHRALFMLRQDLLWLLGSLEEDRRTFTESERAEQLLSTSQQMMESMVTVLGFLERLGLDPSVRSQVRTFFHEINDGLMLLYAGVSVQDSTSGDFNGLLGLARDRIRDYLQNLFSLLNNGHPEVQQFNLIDRLRDIGKVGGITLHVSERTDETLEVSALPEALRSLLDNLQRGAERLAREQGIALESHLLVDAPLSLTESHVRLRFVTNLQSTPLTSDRLQELLKKSPSKGLSGGLGFYLTHQRLAASQRRGYAWDECLFLRKATSRPHDAQFHEEDERLLREAGLQASFLFEIVLDGLAVNQAAERAEIALTLELNHMAAERVQSLGPERDEYFDALFDRAFGAVLILLDEQREPDACAPEDVRELFERVRRRLKVIPL